MTISPGTCPKCGKGKLSEETVEYGKIEYVCFCGGRFSKEQLEKARALATPLEPLPVAEEAEKIQERIDHLKQNTDDADREAAAKTAAEIDQSDNQETEGEPDMMFDKKSEKPAVEETPAPQPREIAYVRTERRRARKCKECQFYRSQADETWCITHSCPSHYPRKLRPRYHSLSYIPVPEKAAASAAKPSPKEKPPRLPEWQEAWGDSVKVAWLQAREKNDRD